MQVLYDAWNLDEYPSPSVVTVGNFDGIHLGQQAVIRRVVSRAGDLGAVAIVVTFEPHPLDVLRPDRPPERITTMAQKECLIASLGVEYLMVIRFSTEFSQTPAREFVGQFLHHNLGAREVYVGSKFGFGRGREGDLDLLQSMGADLGFEATGIEEVVSSQGTISSTRIREAVRRGLVGEAADLLGRTFAVVGSVVHGEGRGKQHGWPTINVEVEHDLMPAEGVYASQVWLPQIEQELGAVTNIGRRPTFPGSTEIVVESHIFDFDQDIYGQPVELGFVQRLRGEKKFGSVDALIDQIGDDAKLAREYLRQKDCSRIVPTLGSRHSVNS